MMTTILPSPCQGQGVTLVQPLTWLSMFGLPPPRGGAAQAA